MECFLAALALEQMSRDPMKRAKAAPLHFGVVHTIRGCRNIAAPLAVSRITEL